MERGKSKPPSPRKERLASHPPPLLSSPLLLSPLPSPLSFPHLVSSPHQYLLSNSPFISLPPYPCLLFPPLFPSLPLPLCSTLHFSPPFYSVLSTYLLVSALSSSLLTPLPFSSSSPSLSLLLSHCLLSSLLCYFRTSCVLFPFISSPLLSSPPLNNCGFLQQSLSAAKVLCMKGKKGERKETQIRLKKRKSRESNAKLKAL